jgi:hypothetical protein
VWLSGPHVHILHQLTSPSNRSMRKLLLLIFNCGVLGKQHKQLDNE